MGALNRLGLVALVTGAVTAVLMAIGLTLGAVALNARMHPDKRPRVPTPMPGKLYVIPDSVYNLGEPNRYLKATVVLELDTAEKKSKEAAALEEEVKKREAQIKDIIIRVINGMSFNEVNSPHGKALVKEAIRKKINDVLARGEIKEVLFTSFAMQ